MLVYLIYKQFKSLIIMAQDRIRNQPIRIKTDNKEDSSQDETAVSDNNDINNDANVHNYNGGAMLEEHKSLLGDLEEDVNGGLDDWNIQQGRAKVPRKNCIFLSLLFFVTSKSR